MKKYLLLLVGLTIIACSKDDDSGNTIDPLIGTWTVEDGNDSGTLVFNQDGTFTQVWRYQNDSYGDEFGGTWRNNGSDFSATIQIYTTTEENSEGIDDGEEYIDAIVFSEDFNSWQYQEERCSAVEGSDFCDDYENETYIRQ